MHSTKKKLCPNVKKGLWSSSKHIFGQYARYDESDSWSYIAEMRLNGKNVRPALLITLGVPFFSSFV